MAARKKPPVVSNVAAAASGDPRVALEQLRDTLAAAVDEAPTMVVAQVAGQYRQVLEALAKLAPVEGVAVHDQLAARRRDRAKGRGATPTEAAPSVRAGRPVGR